MAKPTPADVPVTPYYIVNIGTEVGIETELYEVTITNYYHGKGRSLALLYQFKNQ